MLESRILFWIASNGLEWPRMASNGLEWPRMASKKISRMVAESIFLKKNGAGDNLKKSLEWPRMASNGLGGVQNSNYPKISRMPSNGLGDVHPPGQLPGY